MAGTALIVLGVTVAAVGIAWGTFPFAVVLYVLGFISVIIGLVMVIGALWIDLSQLNRERSKAP